MPLPLQIEIGKQYSFLTVVRELSKLKRPNQKYPIRYFECRCDCGNKTKVPLAALNSGNTKSCGCRKNGSGRKNHNYRHGCSSSGPNAALYYTWKDMINRCENPKHKGYKNWGKRGITICEEWHDIRTFVSWALSKGWKKGLTIDRIENNGNYEPSNCQFITRSENCAKHRYTTKVPSGELHHNAKLTWENVRMIREIGHSVPYAYTAKKFGVNPEMISNIVRNKSWK